MPRRVEIGLDFQIDEPDEGRQRGQADEAVTPAKLDAAPVGIGAAPCRRPDRIWAVVSAPGRPSRSRLARPVVPGAAIATHHLAMLSRAVGNATAVRSTSPRRETCIGIVSGRER